MYKTFYQLARNPFDLTPDPVCFVPTSRHNEALAALYHGVRNHKGFIVVTGEVGTGKTLLLRCLINVLKDSQDINFAYVFNGRLSPTEFLQYILADFGLNVAGKNKYELLLDMGRFLVSRAENKMTTALIVDEAHHLSEDILEEVRLLSNLETSSDKLLQIVLVGQPELDEKLDSVKLRQLKQRIAVRTSLRALSHEETKEYIIWRLRVAGDGQRPDPLFPQESISSIYRYSGGLPRVINTICENSLIAAYVNQLPCVTAEIVEEVAQEFRLDKVTRIDEQVKIEPDKVDIRRAMDTLLEWISVRRPSGGSVVGQAGWETLQESKHEPYI
jgi:general secretion pathway protein A